MNRRKFFTVLGLGAPVAAIAAVNPSWLGKLFAPVKEAYYTYIGGNANMCGGILFDKELVANLKEAPMFDQANKIRPIPSFNGNAVSYKFKYTSSLPVSQLDHPKPLTQKLRFFNYDVKA